MRRWTIGAVVIATLACGGFGGHGEFAVATAEMLAKENDDVECRLASTGGGSLEMMDWQYTFGDPVVRHYPEEMRPVKDTWGKVVGQREWMMVVPVTIENTLPKKRKHWQLAFLHRRDGEVFNAWKKDVPSWVHEAIGKPNIQTHRESFGPSQSVETYAMFTVQSPEEAVGSVIRMYWTEEKPQPDNPRRTYHATQGQICIEVEAVETVDDLVKPG